MVYDNMRNVVSRFIGTNEKILNENLLKMSMYCGFNINVTNCFKGNEKGSVEMSGIRKRYGMYAVAFISGFTDGI